MTEIIRDPITIEFLTTYDKIKKQYLEYLECSDSTATHLKIKYKFKFIYIMLGLYNLYKIHLVTKSQIEFLQYYALQSFQQKKAYAQLLYTRNNLHDINHISFNTIIKELEHHDIMHNYHPFPYDACKILVPDFHSTCGTNTCSYIIRSGKKQIVSINRAPINISSHITLCDDIIIVYTRTNAYFYRLSDFKLVYSEYNAEGVGDFFYYNNQIINISSNIAIDYRYNTTATIVIVYYDSLFKKTKKKYNKNIQHYYINKLYFNAHTSDIFYLELDKFHKVKFDDINKTIHIEDSYQLEGFNTSEYYFNEIVEYNINTRTLIIMYTKSLNYSKKFMSVNLDYYTFGRFNFDLNLS